MSAQYKEIVEQRKRWSTKSEILETNDCAVIALAAAVNVDYETAWEALRREGREIGKGTWDHQTMAALKKFGFKTREVFLRTRHTYGTGEGRWIMTGYGDMRYAPVRKIDDTIIKNELNLKGRTPRALDAELFKKAPGRKFLIWNRRHILCFNGASICDWSKNRKLMVLEIHEVLPA